MKFSKIDWKIISSESLQQIYLTTQQVMMVFISKLTLGASKTLHAKMLFTAAFVILTLNIPLPGLWMARPAPGSTLIVLLWFLLSLRLRCTRPYIIIRVWNNKHTGLVSLCDGILIMTGDLLEPGFCGNYQTQLTRWLRRRGRWGPSPSLSRHHQPLPTYYCTSAPSLYHPFCIQR